MSIEELFVRTWYYDMVGNSIRFIYIGKLIEAINAFTKPISSRVQEAA